MSSRGIRLGSLFGIPIQASFSWIFIVALLTVALSAQYGRDFPYLGAGTRLSLGLSAALMLFGSVLAHELSHAVVALRHRMRIRAITLFLFGGAAEMIDEPPSPAAELKVAVAGPVMSVALAASFGTMYYWSLGTLPAPFTSILSWLAIANGILAAFNVVPGFPLDGGRVLRAILWGIWGRLAPATRVASGLGAFFGSMMIFFGLYRLFVLDGSSGRLDGIWLILIGFFLRGAARSSYQQILVRKELEGLCARDLMSTDVVAVPSYMSVADIVDDLVLGKGLTEVLVLEGEQLAGVLRLEDIRGRDKSAWVRLTAEDLLRRDVVEGAVSPDDDVFRILSQLDEGDHLLPVVESGKVVGVLTRKDVTRKLNLRMELRNS